MAEDGILTQTHQPKAVSQKPMGEFKSAPYSLVHNYTPMTESKSTPESPSNRATEAHPLKTDQPRTGVGPEQKD